MIVNLLIEGHPFRVRISGDGTYEYARDNDPYLALSVDLSVTAPGELSLLQSDGTSLSITLDRSPLGDAIVLRGRRYEFAAHDPRSLNARRSAVEAHHGPVTLKSPMPGRIVRILCSAGVAVAAKQGVLVVEAMKMQNELKSPRAGVVDSILVKEGDSVVAGQALAVVR